MTPALVSRRVVGDRMAHIEESLAVIRTLPLDSRESFLADPRNVWTAESCLRRGLEALFDLGRHILAKAFGRAAGEYKEIGRALGEAGVLEKEEADVLRLMAGYRNRMVHFYHEISAEELYALCSARLGDFDLVTGACRRWIAAHPEKVDTSP